jgi:hypothetical protein
MSWKVIMFDAALEKVYAGLTVFFKGRTNENDLSRQ